MLTDPAPKGPRFVVVPFGVPEDGRGLGLGLAALVHHFGRLEADNVALAQLLSRPQAPSEKPTAAEAAMNPAAWSELEKRGDAPRGVEVVITGNFEPPDGGSGLLELVAFDPSSGKILASGETTVLSTQAGRAVAETCDRVFREMGGELDLASRVGELEWEALESILYAERAAIYDPVRGEPHDRMAALIHLGRAVEEAPRSRYAASRLSHLALEAAMLGDRRLAEAGHRALARASADAPANIDLLEARAALELRLGSTVEAEVAALSALAQSPGRSRLHALVSEARRTRGDFPAANAAIAEGFTKAGRDPILLTEYGTLQVESGDATGARHAWLEALSYSPIFPPAFLNLAALALRERDETGAASLVDRALTTDAAHPEVLRRAVVLALAFEPEGLARAARIVKIGNLLLSHAPNDVWALLATAHALSQTGPKEEAKRRFQQVERLAADTALAAEAARGLFHVEAPAAAREIDETITKALSAERAELELIACRARALALEHGVWTAKLAVGIAERRLGLSTEAYQAFEETLERAPGCVEAHLELATLAAEVDRPVDAVAHAERALELAGESRQTLLVLGQALVAARQPNDARLVIDRLLAADADDPAALRLLGDLERSSLAPPPPPPASTRGKLAERLARFSDRFRR